MYNRFPNSAAAKPEDSVGGGSTIGGSTTTANNNSNNSNNLPLNTAPYLLPPPECNLGNNIPLAAAVNVHSEGGEPGDNSDKGAAPQW